MSLNDMLRNGELEKLPASEEELANLLATAERRMADANLGQLSNETRFVLAYQCALSCATAALRQAGYRVPGEHNKHLRTIDTLRFTLKLTAHEIALLHKARKKRNEDLYEGTVEISDEERDSVLELAGKILNDTRALLKA